MVIDDLALGQTLGPGRADKVSVQHLQHVGAGVTHEGTDADDHQRDDGQNQMMSHVHELPEGGQLLVTAARQTVQVKPAQLHREHQLQQGSKEEGGQRNTGQSQHRNDIVCLAVLLGGGNDAQGDRDDDLQDEGDEAHEEGDPHTVVEYFRNRLGPQPAVAELEGQHLAQPLEEAGNNAHVQIVHAGELSHPLLKGLGTGLHGLLTRHRLHVGRGETPHQRVDNECDEE